MSFKEIYTFQPQNIILRFIKAIIYTSVILAISHFIVNYLLVNTFGDGGNLDIKYPLEGSNQAGIAGYTLDETITYVYGLTGVVLVLYFLFGRKKVFETDNKYLRIIKKKAIFKSTSEIGIFDIEDLNLTSYVNLDNQGEIKEIVYQVLYASIKSSSDEPLKRKILHSSGDVEKMRYFSNELARMIGVQMVETKEQN